VGSEKSDEVCILTKHRNASIYVEEEIDDSHGLTQVNFDN
jgi:hypothetical protein